MRIFSRFIVACLSTCLFAGCGNEIEIDDVDITALLDAVGLIQTRPQELPPVLVNQGDTIIINTNVTIINNPAVDIIPAELPNLTVLGFENDTDWDIYIRYLADGELQGIYVYQGEALLLGYPCLEEVALLSEDDIDPVTGALVDSFDLTGADFFNPEDFLCGDALILNFDPSSVSASAEVVDLAP
ncbi:MAG TPA: hypothetical protein VJZ71_03690 [Phycisphaerae bacterium]|nr:hypothetical protein [Phycisphaerae bacterium]